MIYLSHSIFFFWFFPPPLSPRERHDLREQKRFFRMARLWSLGCIARWWLGSFFFFLAIKSFSLKKGHDLSRSHRDNQFGFQEFLVPYSFRYPNPTPFKPPNQKRAIFPSKEPSTPPVHFPTHLFLSAIPPSPPPFFPKSLKSLFSIIIAITPPPNSRLIHTTARPRRVRATAIWECAARHRLDAWTGRTRWV